MHFLTLLATTLSLGSVALVSAGAPQWHCPFASDGSGLNQDPTCCKKSEPLGSSKDSILGTDCFNISPTDQRPCPGGAPLWCCYEMGPKYACTTTAKWNEGDDIE